MQLYSCNKKIACEPMASTAIQVQGREKGFATAKQSTQLIQLRVVYDGEGFVPGDTLYIAAENTTMEWAKRVYTVDEKKPFILVPLEAVLLVAERAKE